MKKVFTSIAALFLMFHLNMGTTMAQLPGSNQIGLIPANIPQFVDPLPHFAAGLRVDAKAGGNLIIKTVPHQQVAVSTGTVLDNGTVGVTPGAGVGNYWTYSISKDGGTTFTPPLWPAFTIEAKRGFPLNVTYRNNLQGQTYQGLNLALDQSIMWAAPSVNGNPLVDFYTGVVPISPHLHGGEIQSTSDGGPNAWFTPGYAQKGSSFQQGVDSVYHYGNTQEATTLWIHDHTMGATRLNVFAGLAGFYFLRGPDEEIDKLPGWSGDDLVKELAPVGTSGTFNQIPYLPEIELAIQDRMFDTKGQLLFPIALSPPPYHYLWVPEFFGDVMTVNGKTWPYLSVAPRKYRFHVLDGCNARFLNMWLTNLANNANGPVITQVGTDGGMLDGPINLDPATGGRLFLSPGERADIIIDFTGVTPGTVFTLMTNAAMPYPTGVTPNPLYDGRIMQFVVNGTMVSAADITVAGIDKSLLNSSLRVTPIIKLTDFAGNLNVAPVKKRQLTLNEILGPGGPLQVVVNNSVYDTIGMVMGQFGTLTEKPVEGTTELWQIINITMDAHPIHKHLVQFQLVSRQAINTAAYMMAYNTAFTGGAYMPAGGPPNPYDSLNADGAVGGNPAITPFLTGPVILPDLNERGWKDTYKNFPDQLTTWIVRFAPTDKPLNSPGDSLLYPFDPSVGPGYVWHCHIIDHEDNDMMRPYLVQRSPFRPAVGITQHNTPEGYTLGQNYPNPVKNETEIQFSIPQAGHVQLILKNLLGAEIKTLIDDNAPAGQHTVKLDARGLASGIYFYQLRAGNFTATKKMIISN